MKKVRVCIEVDGLAKDEFGNPCPAGLCMTIGEEQAEEATGAEYEEIIKNVKIEEVLRIACLDRFYKPEDCRMITPEEYDEKYGE